MYADRPLLERHRRLRTTDLGEARAALGAVFGPHEVSTREAAGDVDVRHNAVHWRSVSLHYLSYGAVVDVRHAATGPCYVVMVVLSGMCVVNLGRVSRPIAEGEACVLGPEVPATVRLSRQCRRLLVRYEAAGLTRLLETLVRERVTAPVRFEPWWDLSTGDGALWWRWTRDLAERADAGDRLLEHPLLCGPVEQALVTALLLSHRHNFSPLLCTERFTAPAPRQIRAAVEYVESDPSRPVTVADLARCSGISVRSLQSGFARHLGTSPMAYVQDARLRRVFEDLCSAEVASTGYVAATARKWGFTHLGRFAQAYRQKYGESPSGTLHTHARGNAAEPPHDHLAEQAR